MIQIDKGKRVITVLLVGIITLLTLAGCSSEKSIESSGKSSQSKEDDTEVLYEGADEVVVEYTKAHYEYNLPVLFDLAPPKVQEEYLNDEKTFMYFQKQDGAYAVSSIPMEDLIDPDKFKEIKAEYNNQDYNKNHKTFFQDFNSAKDKLYIVRFDHLYEEEGELAYFVKPWVENSNDPNAGGKKRINGSGHIKLKQNNDGEWKVIETTSGQFRKEGINTSDKDEIRAKGTVIHELEKEDSYGF